MNNANLDAESDSSKNQQTQFKEKPDADETPYIRTLQNSFLVRPHPPPGATYGRRDSFLTLR